MDAPERCELCGAYKESGDASFYVNGCELPAALYRCGTKGIFWARENKWKFGDLPGTVTMECRVARLEKRLDRLERRTERVEAEDTCTLCGLPVGSCVHTREKMSDPLDRWLLSEDKARTKEAIAEEREKTLQAMKHDKLIDNPKAVVFACDSCDLASRCTLLFDPYNTNGDCLLEK